MVNYSKKSYKIAGIALIFAIIGWILPGTTTTTESIFEIEINNTNLAPTVSGEPIGTGERVQGITYYANSTPLELFVFSHGNSSGQTSELHLFINGTLVADTSGRPLGVAEQNNRTIVAIIPRYASYKIEANNYHHYEWREYRIISGQNGSVNLTTNYYNISGTVDNTSLNTKLNKSGDNLYGELYNNVSGINSTLKLTGGQTTINSTNTTSGNTSDIVLQPEEVSIEISDGSTTGLFISPTDATLQIQGVNNYIFNSTELDISYKNITNCANCPPFNVTDNKSYTNNLPAQLVSSYWHMTWTDSNPIQGTWVQGSNTNQGDFDGEAVPTAGFIGGYITANNNDEIDFNNISLNAGSYKVSFATVQNTDSGILEVLIGSTSLGTYDQYGVLTYNVKKNFTYSPTSRVSGIVRLKATGKNASATAYSVRVSRLEIIRCTLSCS